MSQNGKQDCAALDPIALMDALLDDAAEQAAEDGIPTENDVEWSREVDAMVMSKLAELQRQATSSQVPLKRGVTIPSHIQALDRQSLLAQLEILRQGANVRYAHQDLTGLSDNDLRTMLTLLVVPTER
jgi:hypothetical protein